MDAPVEYGARLKPLSRRVYEVLEDIGVSVEVRKVKMEAKSVREILLSLCEIDEPYSHYIFGSSFEGTTTTGLQSDLDEMMVDEYLPVVTDIYEARMHEKCYLIVQDHFTPPGYAKLQLVSKGVCCHETYSSLPEIARSSFDIDSENRCLMTVLVSPTFVYAHERHGPAFTTINEDIHQTQDTVPGLRCRSWPHCAMDWFTRKRRNILPSSLIDTFKNLGCFFVCVGHPCSTERHLQWRISFSLQERLMITSFNSVQLKCYVLLKLIKNEIIYPRVGQPSITSYHCKTCMFYLIENTPQDLWVEDNLMICVLARLKQLQLWIEENVCPNYFIPFENMFDGRIPKHIQAKVLEALTSLISADFKYLTEIKADNFAQRLENTVSPTGEWLGGVYVKSLMKLQEYYMCFAYIQSVRKSFLQSENETEVTNCLKRGLILKQKLQTTRVVNEHTEEETQRATSYIKPYIELDILTNLLAKSVEMQKSKDEIFECLCSSEWQTISEGSDAFSTKLKQASLLCAFQYYVESLAILSDLERKLRDYEVITVCHCGIINLAYPENFVFERRCTEFKELIRHHSIPCSLFYQSEGEITPIALRYEMIRSVYADFHDIDSYWAECAEVDGRILLYYLLYLNHTHLGMNTCAAADVRHAMGSLTSDVNLGHKETALNLIGWMFQDQGEGEKAETFFRKSLMRRPYRNAAIWHMLWRIVERFRL